MLKRLSTTTIYVKDQNEALRFYTEKLGFEVRADVTMEGYRWLTVGLKDQPDLDCALAALKVGGPLNDDDIHALSKLIAEGKLAAGVFKTDDCQKTYEQLKAKGVEFMIPPTDRPYGIIEAVFKDTTGNLLVLSQDKH